MLGLIMIIVSLIWLATLGEYDVLAWGIGISAFGFLGLSFIITPLLGIFYVTAALLCKLHKAFAYPIALLGIAAFGFGIAYYVDWVYILLLSKSTASAFTPTILLAYASSASPWVELITKQEDDEARELTKGLVCNLFMVAFAITIWSWASKSYHSEVMFYSSAATATITLLIQGLRQLKNGNLMASLDESNNASDHHDGSIPV